MKIGKNDAK